MNIPLKSIIFCLLVLFFSFSSYGQESKIEFEHLRKSDGLTNENISKIYQDKFGFVWIGTESGLNLYDGYEITTFLHDHEDTTSISSNTIGNLTEDENDNIYIATAVGLNIYDRRRKIFKKIKHNSHDSTSISCNEVKYVFIDSKSNLWAATTNGLNMAHLGTMSFKRFFNDPHDSSSIASNIVEEIFEDSEGSLWFASFEGLSKLNPDGETFTNYYHDSRDPESISSNKTMTMFEDSKGNLWIGTLDGGLNLLNRENGKFTIFKHQSENENSLSNNYINSIIEDSKGDIWIGTVNGINILNAESGKITRHFSSDKPDGLTSDVISTLYTTENNQKIWVGTRFGGINIVDQNADDLLHFQYSSSNPNGLNHNNVSDFAEDNTGNFWIATDGGGISHYDKTSGKFTHVVHDPGNPNSLSNDKALAIEVDKNGYVWIGFWGGGIDRYDPKTGKFTHYRHVTGDSTSLTDNNIFYILEDSKGDIWIATWGNGISKYNWKTNDFTNYPYKPEDPNGLPLMHVVSLCEDHLGNIWATSENKNTAISKINPTTHEVTNYHLGSDSAFSLNSSTYVVYEDSKKRFWIGTNGNGLIQFDPKTKSYKNYTSKDGLPSNAVVGILEDGNNNLWLSTFNGICKFDPDSLTFKNYYASDGLQSNQFNRWAFEKLKSGEMLFGGTNGFNLFHPDSLDHISPPPTVYLTDFRMFNKPVKIGENEILQENIMFAKEIELKHHQNFITIEYVGLSRASNEKIQYRYKLEGLQNEWVLAGNERKASYTNLDPGNYIFKVMASSYDGVWSEKAASVVLSIKPPFWATWWFRLLTIAFLISITLFLFYLRIKRIRIQKLKLQKEVREQTFIIRKKNETLASQKNELKAANKEIKDSIRAAELIQRSILPAENRIIDILNDSFILYLPKDIVGGDFYWIDEINGKKYVAVIDCAGHGISGAFMSINAHHLINKVLGNHEKNSASSILNSLNKEVIREFNNSKDAPELVESMDLSLCIIDKSYHSLVFSGANLPLYLLRNDEIIQFSGNNFAIGSAFDIDSNPFREQKIDLQEGDILYMFSDGYADQIGGEKGQEKFLYSRFRDLLLEIGKLGLKEQKKVLHERLKSWKKDVEQLDDILIVGVRI